MEIPKDTKTLELRTSVVWFDENGILHSRPNPGIPPPLDMEEVREDMEKFKEFTNHEKVCILTESNPNSKPPSKEERDLIAEQLNSVVKAMAIVTTSPVSRMIANLFFGLKPPPYPAKMFSTEEEAIEWIKQYL